MGKIWTIALREYRAMVGTKAFLFSICMMPILMFGSILALRLLRHTGSVQERTILIADRTGGMVPAIRMAALAQNAAVQRAAQQGPSAGFGEVSFSKGSIYRIEELPTDRLDDARRLELCERIRRGELYAFVDIPPDVDLQKADGTLPEIDFYSEDSGMSDSRRWLAGVLNERIVAMRLQRVGIDFTKVQQAQRPVRMRGLGLLEQSATGEILPGQEKDEATAILLPLAAMMLMFMVTFLAAQPMLESVLEEKSQRIAEVLLGCANPWQLMSGKLLGTVAGSLTVFAIYAVGVFAVARSQGVADQVPLEIVPWFVLFQVFSVLLYAAIFMAVGSSVSQLKEAQALLLPVWMVMMAPMFVWIFVVQEPNSPMAVGMSLFPPATPPMMMLRMATGATIPVWQPLLGLLLLALSTIGVVFLAARIFRVGILWQGKTPRLGELCRWALSG